MPSMIATGLSRYGTTRLEPGDVFDVRDQDVRTLLVLRKARLADAPDPAVEIPRPKRRYRRRDLTAEP